MNKHLRLQLLEQRFGAGVHRARPCPVCGETWRPFAFSYLPCHAKCLLTDEAVETFAWLYANTELSLIQIAERLGVTRAVAQATLKYRVAGRG